MAKCLLPGDAFQLQARLIDIGESITINLRDAMPGDTVDIFSCYLERCDPTLAR